MGEPTNWRAMADALTAAMTDANGPPEGGFIRDVAWDAVAWLADHGYAIVANDARE